MGTAGHRHDSRDRRNGYCWASLRQKGYKEWVLLGIATTEGIEGMGTADHRHDRRDRRNGYCWASPRQKG